MNPGNGIETVECRSLPLKRHCFLFMNPGNGIETGIWSYQYLLTFSFLFMNPGNGIETCRACNLPSPPSPFLIYESRQRD